jgi:hypothetical protein
MNTPMNKRHEQLADLALKMGLAPNEAIVLPAAIANASRKAARNESWFIAECVRNAELREYIAGACRKVAAGSA